MPYSSILVIVFRSDGTPDDAKVHHFDRSRMGCFGTADQGRKESHYASVH